MKVREIKKTIVLEDNHNVNIEEYISEVKKMVMVKNPIMFGSNVTLKRETGNFMKKELVIKRSYMENPTNIQIIIQKQIKLSLNERENALKSIYFNMIKVGSDLNKIESELEWKEHVVRVGTGFRVRKDENDPSKRRFDVGYADVKEYKRKENREVTVDSSSISMIIVGKGKNARVKVINAVSDIEKRQPVSKYTGSGIMLKSNQGKIKLKSTKSGSK